VLFAPVNTLTGKKKSARAPLTYVNRLLLKRAYKNLGGIAVTRERTFIPAQGLARKRPLTMLIMLILLTAAVVGAHLSGASPYLQQEKLHALISSYGALAPALYILIYTLASVLFLPALPITIVGGIVFGPVWGVIHTISGATMGASLAFLMARHVVRDQVAARLRGPKWEQLDDQVARHGWKVVAFTRLIPVFPFNLLNYAFGLTKIPFSHYVVTSFVCMLPACIAFIVFSSSLPGLIKGAVSPSALLGVGLIALVSLIPLIHRRFKARRASAVEIE
jgi:uncharacterized membrane protein YdjX (TVP38/TMEM64 family)